MRARLTSEQSEWVARNEALGMWTMRKLLREIPAYKKLDDDTRRSAVYEGLCDTALRMTALPENGKAPATLQGHIQHALSKELRHVDPVSIPAHAAEGRKRTLESLKGDLGKVLVARAVPLDAVADRSLVESDGGLSQRVNDLLATLTRKQRHVVEECLLHDRTQDSVAEDLGIPRQAVCKMLKRATRRMRAAAVQGTNAKTTVA